MTNLEARKKALKAMIKQQPKPKAPKKVYTANTSADEASYSGAPADRGTLA